MSGKPLGIDATRVDAVSLAPLETYRRLETPGSSALPAALALVLLLFVALYRKAQQGRALSAAGAADAVGLLCAALEHIAGRRSQPVLGLLAQLQRAADAAAPGIIVIPVSRLV